MFVQIQADRDYRLKISWGNDEGIHPVVLLVDKAPIDQASENLRLQLNELSDWSNSTDQAQRNARLTELSRLGAGLRFLLFDDARDRNALAQLTTWIADQIDDGDRDLSIIADPSVKVPWGLIFDGTPLAAPTGKEGDAERDAATDFATREVRQFAGFWCLKYRLSAKQMGNPLSRGKMKRPRQSFGLLSLVGEELQQQVQTDLGTDYAGYYQLLSAPVGIVHDVEECRKSIASTPVRDILFHLFGHQKDATLDLGNGKLIDYATFAQLMEAWADREAWRNSAPRGLVFLNGCEGAVGNGKVDLRQAVKRPELCGLIATEALVRRDFAAKFGYRFLKAMLEDGDTVAGVMDKLHHDAALWPESLLYGCYAHPYYCIAKAA